MKVLQVINSLGAGGAEKLVVETSLLFAKKGIEINILLLNGEKTPLFDSLKIANNTIQVYSLVGNIYNPLHVFKIKSFFKNYDIIHAHLFPVSYWVAFANFFSLKKKPIIFTEHNTTNRRRSIFIFKIIDRLVYKQFKKTVTISEAVDVNLKKHLSVNEKTKRITKIHNGIDLKKIQQAIAYTKEELGFEDLDKLVLQVASFTPQKDQKTLIKAIQLLPKNVKLLLVGSGPLIEEYKNFIKTEQIEDRVFFLGIRNDVPRLLKSVDIVALSSHYEGLSLSCIEGMASGKPFIASNTPGLGDIVDGSGIVFEDSNYKELADTIIDLLNNDTFSAKVATQCIKKAQYFDINIMVTSYIELFKKLVD
ncbi:glycosyltransferase [Aquimarina agarilytica]|uniref:glycosyltransferase n=1 Tax=Aquimarina agarilytica TaxID=1087449 RepID=UPI000289CF6A|nr:glycosyltransferase [Aquimarina agarilytica]